MKKVRTTCIYYVEEQKVVCDFIAMFLRFIGILVKKSKVRIAGDEEFDLILNLESLEGIQNFHYDAYKDIPLEEKQTYQLLGKICKMLINDEKGYQELMQIAKVFVEENIGACFLKSRMIRRGHKGRLDNSFFGLKQDTVTLIREICDNYLAADGTLRDIKIESIQDYFSYCLIYLAYCINECYRLVLGAFDLKFDNKQMLKDIDEALEKFPNFINLYRLKAYIIKDDVYLCKLYGNFLHSYIDKANEIYSKGVLICLNEAHMKLNRQYNSYDGPNESKSKKAEFTEKYLAKFLEYDEQNYEMLYWAGIARKQKLTKKDCSNKYFEKIINLINYESKYLNPTEQLYLYKAYREIGISEVRISKNYAKALKLFETCFQLYENIYKSKVYEEFLQENERKRCIDTYIEEWLSIDMLKMNIMELERVLRIGERRKS